MALKPAHLKITQEEFLANLKAHDAENTVAPITTKLWVGEDGTGGRAKSQTLTTTTIKIRESNEEITVPIWRSTKVHDVAEVLATKLGIDSIDLTFIHKQGCAFRTLYESDEMPKKCFVKGIRSFARQPHSHGDPHVIIGTGHCGLRAGMIFLDRNIKDFIIFDRHEVVGGTSWLSQANHTSKLQTEFGVYHLNWKMDAPLPDYFLSPWPSRDELLEMFQRTVEDYGLLPYCRLNTNVKTIDIIRHKDSKDFKPWEETDYFDLTLESTVDSKQPKEKYRGWSVQLWPGNLTIPRRETYKGEELFGGPIGYGMHSAFDYDQVTGQSVMIVGHGAFAVENVRTCCEYSSHKIYMVCRRKNMSCPRVVSWLANRSFTPVTAASFVRAMEPMYNLVGFDPWSYYAIHANQKRTVVSIQQKARFGIGDVYFVALYYEKLEVIVEPRGPIKRLAHHTVHLESGRKLEVTCILKLLGFYGDPDNDRLMRCKEVVGNWVNGDTRRFMWAEPISVQASNFGGTSFSPGVLGMALCATWFMAWPMDLQPVLDSNLLPRFSGDMDDGRPTYVVDARHAVSTGVLIASMVPGRGQEDNEAVGVVKPMKQRLCHPINKFIAEAKEDWDRYCQRFEDEGFKKPWPEYPYTALRVKQMVKEHMQETGEPPLPSDYEDLDESKLD